MSSGILPEGTLIFLHPQCPITRTHLRQRETESYNILNCSNNKIIFGKGLFCHTDDKRVAKRQGHRSLEFHIVHLLEPAPQTQTAMVKVPRYYHVVKSPLGGGGGGV